MKVFSLIFLDSVYRRVRVQGSHIQVRSAVMDPSSDVLHLKSIFSRRLWMAVLERFVNEACCISCLKDFQRFLSLRNGPLSM